MRGWRLRRHCWLRQGRNVLLRTASVNCNLLGLSAGAAKEIVYWRALHSYRRLLVTRQIRDWRLVETSSGVNVNSVDSVVERLTAVYTRARCLVLPSWCEQKTAVRGERKTSKEAREGLVRVYVRVAQTHS